MINWSCLLDCNLAQSCNPDPYIRVPRVSVRFESLCTNHNHTVAVFEAPSMLQLEGQWQQLQW